MERSRNWMLQSLRATSAGIAAAVALGAVMLAAAPAVAQELVTIRVVDQNGTELTGSTVRPLGTEIVWETPATVPLDMGPQLFTIEPAFQGTMLPGGWARPQAANGLSRDEMVFYDGGPELLIEWRTGTVGVGVVDQNGAAIPGSSWSFAGEGAWFAAGTLVAPITDESVYEFLQGVSVNGWSFAARAAFDGQAIDLTRTEAREVNESMTGLSLEWRQLACTMGVVADTEAPIRGATWTMLGHTFAAGDAITLPVTDNAFYPSLAGAFATGMPADLFTNTPVGSGSGTFEVGADGVLSPAFISIGGSSFGLRCGVSPFPPITTGTLDGTVAADGSPFTGAHLTALDANGATHNLTTDGAGGFLLTNVPQGDVTVTLSVPAGYHAVDPASGQRTVTIVAEQTTTANFTMAADETEPPVANNPETWNYWRKEVRAALRDHGPHEETLDNMAKVYPQTIFKDFANHPDPVRVEGVTQVDPDGAGGAKVPRALTLADMERTLEPGGATPVEAAKRELLVLLLNVVSGRLSLNLIVDEAGTTLEQEIRNLAAMINDGVTANDRKARNHAARINAGRAGWRRPDAQLFAKSNGVAYGDTDLEYQLLSDESPNAGSTTVVDAVSLTATLGSGSSDVRLTMTLNEMSHASLTVYDAAGRKVAQLYEGDAPAGVTAVTWQRNGTRRGVYFARLVTNSGARTAKIVAAQ